MNKGSQLNTIHRLLHFVLSVGSCGREAHSSEEWGGQPPTSSSLRKENRSIFDNLSGCHPGQRQASC
jgi:hypothetical protein